MTVLAEFVFLLLMAIGCWDGLGGKMALNLDPECGKPSLNALRLIP